MTSQEERAREILAATAKVAEWIGFSGGAIKDGLGWTDEARELHDEARAALAVLSDAPFALAAEVREDAAKAFEDAIAEGYDVPASKVEQCEHGNFGWEDCIACYDQHLHARIAAIRAQGGVR